MKTSIKVWVALPSIFVLHACTGLYLDLPDEESGHESNITVQPITPELVAKRAVATPVTQRGLPGVSVPYVYHVGVGDILDISIPSIASAPYTPSVAPAYPSMREPDRGYAIAPDGSIWLPYVGSIAVKGLTIREVQDHVIKELSRFIKAPQVAVSVKEFRSQKVLIAGQVPKPGYLPITDVPLTLLGALTSVGSTPQMRSDLVARAITSQPQQMQTESGDYRRVQLTRSGKPQTIDVIALLQARSQTEDPLLVDGDQIFVAPVERDYVYVLGEVKQPTLMEIVQQRTSLAEVLISSGGINQQTAKAERVYVIRGDFNKPEVFQLNSNEADALLLADAFIVRPRDVIYVAEANVSRWNRVLGQLVPTMQTLITGGIFANQVD